MKELLILIFLILKTVNLTDNSNLPECNIADGDKTDCAKDYAKTKNKTLLEIICYERGCCYHRSE